MNQQISKTHAFAVAILSFSLAAGLSGCNSKTEPAAAPALAPAPEQQAVAAPQQVPEAAQKPAAERAEPSMAHEHESMANEPKATQKKKPVVQKSTQKTTSGERTKSPACQDCGTVSAINTIEKEGEGTGLGAVAGGVAGALLGHQVGGGTGKDIATIAGAAGGAYAGHQIEKKIKKTVTFEVSVKMDDGVTRTISYKEKPAYAVGDKVKIVDGQLQSR